MPIPGIEGPQPPAGHRIVPGSPPRPAPRRPPSRSMQKRYSFVNSNSYGPRVTPPYPRGAVIPLSPLLKNNPLFGNPGDYHPAGLRWAGGRALDDPAQGSGPGRRGGDTAGPGRSSAPSVRSESRFAGHPRGRYAPGPGEAAPPRLPAVPAAFSHGEVSSSRSGKQSKQEAPL